MSRSAYLKFKEGKQLSRKQAMAAQCFECNGYTAESKDDCLGFSCALYPWSPWGKKRVPRIQKHSISNLRGRKEKSGALPTL